MIAVYAACKLYKLIAAIKCETTFMEISRGPPVLSDFTIGSVNLHCLDISAVDQYHNSLQNGLLDYCYPEHKSSAYCKKKVKQLNINKNIIRNGM